MKESAGIVLYRQREATEFFLVHPGGPFFVKKDAGWWTIPKGEPNAGEPLLQTAVREFAEETGYTPSPPFKELVPITQKGGKRVWAWAAEGDVDPEKLTSNTFEVEWPPRSGKKASFPEIDRAGWFGYSEACTLINEKQRDLLGQALHLLDKSHNQVRPVKETK